MLKTWTKDDDAADDIIDRLLAAALTAPFHFLRQHDPSVIVQHLHEEHPQTIALVLAYLPTKFAAAVLAGFEPDLQSDVALRIAMMEPAAPDVVKRVEDAMRTRMGGSARRSNREDRGGVKELAQMLNNSDRGTERAILDSLEIMQPELADEIRSLMFVFEDVVHFDDRTMQQLLRNVDMKVLGLAMKGVRNEIRQLVFRNLSERAAITLKEEIELLGPVPIKDVEGAQSEIVALIRKLEDEGVIVMARAGEGQFVE
jgi:flagellar motor switch protein FliG